MPVFWPCIRTAIGVCGSNVTSLKSSCSVNALCEVSSNGRELVNCSCKDGYLGIGLICHSKCMCCHGNYMYLNNLNLKSDIDECDIGRHTCHINANCSDTPGSYECHCKDGFFGNGTICIG